MPFYIAGGIYPHLRGEFLLVRPIEKDSLPYVSSNPNGSLLNSTKHHSHYYRVEGSYAYLEKESYEAIEVEAPVSVRLSPLQIYEIERSFELNDYK
jgi:hypothetical protein